MAWLVAVLLVLTAPQTPATFTIDGNAIRTPMAISAAEMAAMPRESVTLKEDDVDVRYDGVRLSTLLAKAGAPIGALRGKALTTTVLAQAKDDYRVVFSLGELDPEFGGARVIVADQRNGKALFDYQGPFRLIVAGDKRGARGVRMLTRLTVSQPELPPGFPAPPRPPEFSAAKAELGRFLFYDTRLSENGTQSCSSCHAQALAFTDGLPQANGSTGERHPRGSMSLINVAYASNFTWIASDAASLEAQARVPMFGTHPIELGLRPDGATLVTRLRAEPRYTPLFAAAYPHDADAVTIDHVLEGLADFERTLVSARSPYDAYHFGGNDGAVSAAAKRGEVLFFSQPFACFTCHGGANFTSRGLHDGFKAPTLRNIAVTGPYMHDGRVASLAEALTHHNPGVTLTPQQRDDFLAFLDALTDRDALTDPRFANPWPPRR